MEFHVFHWLFTEICQKTLGNLTLLETAKTVVKQWCLRKVLNSVVFTEKCQNGKIRYFPTKTRPNSGKRAVLTRSILVNKKWWFSTKRYVGWATVTQWSLVGHWQPSETPLRRRRSTGRRSTVGSGTRGSGVWGGSIPVPAPWYGSGYGYTTVSPLKHGKC